MRTLWRNSKPNGQGEATRTTTTHNKQLEEVTSNATKTIVATTHYAIVDCYCLLGIFVESTIEIMKL